MTTGTTTFGHADPSWRVPLALPTKWLAPNMIAAGDIVYMRRPGGYQQLTGLAGDTFRHVGVIATIAGFPWLIDMGHGGYGARPFTTVLNAYDTIAIQRIPPCQSYCNHNLLNHVAMQMNFPKDFYSRSELAAIGLNSVLRLPTFTGRVGVEAAEELLRSKLRRRQGLAERAVCTTPVARALDQLCDQHDVDLDALSEKRSTANSTMANSESVIFAMPDDVWRALGDATTSYWVKKDGHLSHVDIDLTADTREGATA